VNEPKAPAQKDLQEKDNKPIPALTKEQGGGRGAADAPAAVPAKAGGSTSGVVIGLVLLISLAAMGAAAYSVFELRQLQSSHEVKILADKSVALERAISQIDERLSQVTVTTQSRLGEQQASSARLDQHLDQIDKTLSELKSAAGAGNRDWLLAEVEYLLRLANQRILVEREVEGAVGLLKAADDILRDAEGISAHSVRQAIAADLARLRAVVKVDVDGVFLKIGAQIDAVDQLKQKRLAFDTAAVDQLGAADMPIDTAQSDWWDQTWSFARRVLGKLGQLVDYRRGNERINPILPPEEVYYLRQNLTLKLEQAQIALLKGNQTAFRYGLEQSKGWIEKYFDPFDITTISMLDTLGDLEAVEVAQRIPDISNSLLQTRQLLSDLHMTPMESSETPATEPNK
jgi:uroporphyrin-3 C-methyltransferase